MPKPKALHPAIVNALKRLDLAEQVLKDTAKDVQKRCAHQVVAEAHWTEFDNARRICYNCRFEEQGSHWSGGAVWSRFDFEEPALGNTDDRLVIPIERDKFYELRLPNV